MKHTLIFLLLAVLLLGLSGCRLNYMEPEEFLDGIAEAIGDSQLTGDEDLIGTRLLTSDEDSYVGEYTAERSHVTGRDVVFGGASIHDRDLFLSGSIKTESGNATIRIRLNGEVAELEPDSDGNFETTLNYANGGNYIIVLYDNFTGTLEMTCEYIDKAK